MGKPEDPLEELRTLLLHDEREQLAELKAHVVDLPKRTEDLTEILPAAIAAGHLQGRKLVYALRDPVSECLRESIRSDPTPLADALFPVIGPAIRKSIAEALRNFTETLNRTVEHSFSAKGLRWRVEAARTGLPFGEVVLKHTLRYRIEEAFLIHRSSGLLIEHVAREESERDNDAVSAMLTAIQDFVRDTFASNDELQQVELGERLLWLLRGPTVMLACLIRGIPAARAREQLQEVVERIHRGYSKELEAFDGDKSALVGLDGELRDCLISEELSSETAASAPATGGPRLSVAKVLVMLALLAGAIVFSWQFWKNWDTERHVRALARALDATPGVVVTSLEKTADGWVLRGLRDPLLSYPADELHGAGLTPDQIHFKWTPYQSMEPTIIERRARLQLKIPSEVDTRLDGSVLVLNGRAPAFVIDTLRRAYPLPAGIDAVDVRGLRPTAGG